MRTGVNVMPKLVETEDRRRSSACLEMPTLIPPEYVPCEALAPNEMLVAPRSDANVAAEVNRPVIAPKGMSTLQRTLADWNRNLLDKLTLALMSSHKATVKE